MGATKRGYMPGQFLCRGGAPSLRRNSAETCCYTAVPGTSVAAARLSRATRYLMALGTPQRETNTKVMTKHKTEHTHTKNPAQNIRAVKMCCIGLACKNTRPAPSQQYPRFRSRQKRTVYTAVIYRRYGPYRTR